jgi:hypothetical protein
MSDPQKINNLLSDAIDHVFTYASHVDEWLIVKKELLRILPVNERTIFSVRDPITKKQRVNQFEILLAKWWSAKTKRPVVMPDE